MMYELSLSEHGAALSGDLTIYTASDLKQQFSELLEARSEWEVDLSGVAEIDTAGLQLMLLLKRKPGANISFVHHSSAVLRVVDLANLAGTLGDPVLISASVRKE